MLPSSRTPEGDNHKCPICGHRVRLEPAAFPTADAPCPHCGHLLWFEAAKGRVPLREFYPSNRQPEPSYNISPEPFDIFERILWTACACSSALIIALNGQFLVSLFWLALMMGFGQVIWPPIYRRVHGWVAEQKNLWVGVACGWAFVPMPLHPAIFMLVGVNPEFGLTPLACGILGLLVGPPLAALEGLAFVGLVNVAVWLITGKGLVQHSGL